MQELDNRHLRNGAEREKKKGKGEKEKEEEEGWRMEKRGGREWEKET